MSFVVVVVVVNFIPLMRKSSLNRRVCVKKVWIPVYEVEVAKRVTSVKNIS